MDVKPGYKLTEVGTIPKDWDTITLENAASGNGLVRGPFGGALKKDSFVERGYKVYEQRNAIYGTVEKGEYFIDISKYRQLERFCVQPGDFIVSCSGTIGSIYQIPKGAPEGIINQALLKISLNNEKVDDGFFIAVFRSKSFQERIKENSHGGAMQNLVGMDVFRKTPFQLPPTRAEQEAIAEALGDVEYYIESMEQLIAKKRQIKQGAMQELLIGKRRLPGFNEEWLETRLGNIAHFLRGNGLSKSKLEYEGRYSCILYGELFTTYAQTIQSVVSRTNSPEGLPSVSGDILMPASTTTVGVDLATASAIHQERVLLGGDIIVLRKKSPDAFDSNFLANYLTYIAKRSIADLAQGITIIHMHGSRLKELTVKIPNDINEQIAISALLIDMNAEIEALETKLNKARQIKQGMMQELLTGRIRLI